jgi:hypothetical protein
MTTWSLDYDEFAALCEQLIGSAPQQAPAAPRRGAAATRGFRGLWFRHLASGGLAPARRLGLRRGFGFPRGSR